VAVTREQGVQATKEVQLAAQRVARENVKLRDLLSRSGYSNDAIDAWVREDGCLHSVERPQLAVKTSSGKIVQNMSLACAPQMVEISGSPHIESGKGTKVLTEAIESEDYLATSTPVDLRSGSLQVSSASVGDLV
jgi:hypothetical protein